MDNLRAALPRGSNAFERSLAEGASSVLPIPLDVEMNPYTASLANLPYLAAHNSVDLWYDDWPEVRKREIIAQYSGQSIIYPGESLPEYKGTRTGTERYLAFADATVLDVVSYPQKVVLGRAVMRKMPIGHPPFKARHLVKFETEKPKGALVLGRSPVGRAWLKTPSRRKLERALEAMRTAKAPETEYSADFAHKRVINIDDAIDIDGGFTLGQFVDRTRLKE